MLLLVLAAAALVTLGLMCLPLLRGTKAIADRGQFDRAVYQDQLREVARGSDNLLPAIRQALKDRCSLGEVCGAMQDVFGKYAPTF